MAIDQHRIVHVLLPQVPDRVRRTIITIAQSKKIQNRVGSAFPGWEGIVGTIQEERIQCLFRSLDLPDQDGKGGYVGDDAEDENYPEDKTANNYRILPRVYTIRKSMKF